MARFGSVITAMVTPFASDGSLDTAAAADLARWLVDHGNDALVLAGTTGESAVLTDPERIELFRVVRAAVDVPLIAGSTTNDTAHSVDMTRAAAEVGMDAVLAVVPYYNKPPQSGLEAHFRAVAAASRSDFLHANAWVVGSRAVRNDIPSAAGRMVTRRSERALSYRAI